MALKIWLFILALSVLSLPISAQEGVPIWLGGKPDITMVPGRCRLYDWFLDEADKQTDGKASRNDLSRMRVINIANKLADHHEEVDLPQYSAEIKYLLIGEARDDKSPYHFSIVIGNEVLDNLLEDCYLLCQE